MFLQHDGDYDSISAAFSWDGRVPEFLNLAHECCERWAGDKQRLALIYEHADRTVERYTYAELDDYASRFANVLKGRGLERGERVSVLLSQHPETTLTHLAAWKLGLVTSPTSVLFGTDALAYRLNDSGARALVTDSDNIDKVRAIRAQCPRLEQVFLIDDAAHDADNFWRVLEPAAPLCTAVQTRADEPAWISYTSGTTGPPKGALQPHRLLLGMLPSLEFVWDGFPRAGDVTWSPADWS